MSFEAFIDEFYKRHPSWREGAVKDGERPKESIVVCSDAPVEKSARVRIPEGMGIGEYTEKEAQRWWDKNLDSKKRAANDEDSWDAKEPEE